MTIARLDAAVICCADAENKESYESLRLKLSESGITVTFSQIEHAVERLGLRWRQCFLPLERLGRRNPGATVSAVEEPASGPDMRAVLDRIERLEQTLTTNGLAEYRGLLQQAQTEAQLAKDRAAAMRADIRAVLEQLDRISRRQDILYNIVGSVRLEHDRQKAAAARSLLQDTEHASPEETQQ
jgi:hypothetical protein